MRYLIIPSGDSTSPTIIDEDGDKVNIIIPNTLFKHSQFDKYVSSISYTRMLLNELTICNMVNMYKPDVTILEMFNTESDKLSIPKIRCSYDVSMASNLQLHKISELRYLSSMGYNCNVITNIDMISILKNDVYNATTALIKDSYEELLYNINIENSKVTPECIRHLFILQAYKVKTL